MRVAWALLLGLAAPVLAADAGGALLPIQDRSGDPALAAEVQAALRARLFPQGEQVDAAGLRDAMRRLRLRDPLEAPPRLLAELAREVGAGWFFAATLHQANREPVPQVTLAAQVLVPAEPDLAWAGFACATGLDGRKLLGRGLVEDAGELARGTARRLADDYLRGARAGHFATRRVPPARGGYLRAPLSAPGLGAVAVIPFDAVTDREAAQHSAVLTDLALAALHRRGVRLVHPGLVAEVLLQRGVQSRGELDGLTRAALGIATPVDHIFTGTAESYRSGATSQVPDPWIAFSARALQVDNGHIVWADGLERRGSDGSGLLERNRVHGAGCLAEQMMEALVGGLVGGSS